METIFQKATNKGNILDKIATGWKTAELKSALNSYINEMGDISPVGVGAQGFARVLNNPSLPDNDFFTPGKLFEVRTKHSNFPGKETISHFNFYYALTYLRCNIDETEISCLKTYIYGTHLLEFIQMYMENRYFTLGLTCCPSR